MQGLALMAMMAMIATMALAGVSIALLKVVFFGLVAVSCLVGIILHVASMSGERAPSTA